MIFFFGYFWALLKDLLFFFPVFLGFHFGKGSAERIMTLRSLGRLCTKGVFEYIRRKKIQFWVVLNHFFPILLEKKRLCLLQVTAWIFLVLGGKHHHQTILKSP